MCNQPARLEVQPIGFDVAAQTQQRRIPVEVLHRVAACLHEICLYRQGMPGDEFNSFPHGQLLVGYLRGVAVGMGMDHRVLVDRAKHLLEDPTVVDALWVDPS